MKNKLLVIFLITLTLIIGANIFAEEKYTKELVPIYVKMHPEYTEDFKTESKEVNILGETRKLYKTFVYPKRALNAIYDISKEVLDNLKERYFLPEFNKKTIDLYHMSLYQAIEDHVYKNFLEPQVLEFDVFMDTWENDAQNQEIISLLQDRTVSTDFIELLMPYEYEKEIKNNEIPKYEEVKPNIQERRVGMPNLDAAIRYADRYAYEANDYYDYFWGRGDCTNFASQILEAGGVRQEYYDDEFRGWWHKRIKNFWGTSHEHSVSWVQAKTFARYMGILRTYNHRDHDGHYFFSRDMRPGSFIGYDKNNDGDYEHIGFITEVSPSLGNFRNGRYYDYKVAQHTTNYHAWASSDECGWDELIDKGYTIAIIRD